MVSSSFKRGVASAALVAFAGLYSTTAFAQTVGVPTPNTVIPAASPFAPVVAQPGDIARRVATEVVTGGYADVTECFVEGSSPASDRGRLPPCPADLAELGEIQTLEVETIIEEPVLVEETVYQVESVQQVQQVPQIQSIEPVQLDLATVTQGTPCGPGTGTACASNFADLTNVRPFFGTAPAPASLPAPAPVVVAAPPPPPIALPAPPPPPVIAAAPAVVAPVAVASTGLGLGAVAAGAIGLAAIVGLAVAISDDDDDNSTTSTTR